MKANLILSYVFALCFLLINCNSENLNEIESANDDIEIESESIDDFLIEETDLFYEMAIEDLNSSFFKFKTKNLPDCAIVNETDDGFIKVVEINFGDGCSFRDNIYKGIISFSYYEDISSQSEVIEKNFIDFKNGKKLVNGTSKISRFVDETMNTIILEKTSNLNVTKKSGKSYLRLSETNKVINVNESLKKKHYSFSMIGNWSKTFSNGKALSTIIQDTLYRTEECKYFTKGVLQILKKNKISSLDYGDGKCDNLAELIKPDGSIKQVKLGRK